MRQFQYRLCAAVLSVGMACGNIQAAEYPTEQEYLRELPIVLSASRLSQPVSETPNAMTVIDRDMIVASGARNIADVFKLVPGMYVGYENGHTPIVSYRGATDLYARRMQVLVDGRSVYLPLAGQVDWAELPLDIGDIERIEVVRGPAAASHGSNSVQGVISILTRQASANIGPQVSASLGDGGISDFSARLGGVGENWDYRLTFASRADNGFDNRYVNNSLALNDNSTRQAINARINYRPTGSDNFDIRIGYSDTSRELGDLPAAQTAKGLASPLRTQKVLSDFQHVTWLHTLRGNGDFQLSYYHIGRNTRDDRYTTSCAACAFPLNLVAPGSYPVFDDAVIHRHDAELQHTLHTSSDNRIVWGVGARQDSANSPNNLRYSPTWREYRIFAHDEWRLTPISLVNAGAMAEKNALGQTRISPRVSYNRHLSQRNTVRASVSIAYRNPEMVEELGNRYFLLGKVGATQYIWRDMLAAGGLAPERALSREAGYLRQLDNDGTLDMRVYHDQISDIIWVDIAADTNNVVTPRSFKSDFNATYTGLEGTLNYKFGMHSRLTANYAHQIVSARPSRVAPVPSVNQSLIGFAHSYRLTVPLNSASLLFSHDFPGGREIGVGFYHIDPVRVLDGATVQPLTRYLDLRLAQRFSVRQGRKGAGDSEVALVVQNALNDHSFSYNTNITGKRRAYLTATLGL